MLARSCRLQDALVAPRAKGADVQNPLLANVLLGLLDEGAAVLWRVGSDVLDPAAMEPRGIPAEDQEEGVGEACRAPFGGPGLVGRNR